MKAKLVEVIRQAREQNSGCEECDEKDSPASCALMSGRYGCYPSITDEALVSAILSRLEIDPDKCVEVMTQCEVDNYKTNSGKDVTRRQLAEALSKAQGIIKIGGER